MRPSRADAADAALAVAFSVLVLVELGARWDDGYSAGPDLLNLPLLWLVTGSLAVRRRYPVAAMALAFAAVVVPSLVVPHTVFFFGTLVPLAVLTWTAARHTGTAVAVAALAGPVALLLAVPLHQPDFDLPDYLFGTVLFGSAWLAGRAQRALDRRGGALSRELAAQVRDQGE